jgi:tRNA(Ser,Leu) C12 N-acetylase TAN1
MWQFNLVVTLSADGRYRHLLEELRLYGEFQRTEFLGVVLGRVAEVPSFLELVREKRSRQLIAFQDIGRIIPVEQVFTFQADEFLERVKPFIHPYLSLLAGSRFYVRLERRGLKGQIVSPEAERSLDAFLLEELHRLGTPGRIDFADPEAIVVIETIGDRCGIGLLTRAVMERYDFVRVG